MSHTIAAIDHGTTSTRCMLFDHAGSVVGKKQLEHRQIMERPGWVEHDPLEVWRNTQEVLQGALAAAGIGASDVAALGVTNQRETTTVWNRHTGEPYANAIVWQDTRTQGFVDRLAEEGGPDRFREKTGLPLATYFSSTKLHWLLENVSGLREAAEKGDALFGTPDTWLIWNLTGGPRGGAHVTDVSNASRTQLLDLRSLDWDEELLETFGVPRAMLPEIRPSSDPALWGSALGRIPVCGDLGDQQAALFGQSCFDEGEAKNTFGTGCFLLMNTGHEPVFSQSGLLTTVAYQLGDEPAVYALEGSAAIAGALVQWLRDNLDFFDYAQHVEDYARSVEDNGGVYIVPAFSGLYAPYWREDARGVIVGLTRFVNKGHLCRAALEANAYQARDLVEAMSADSGRAPTEIKVDGGMVHNELFMQFQADILDLPVVRPKVAETTALGAAYAAGLAVGFWDGVADLRAQWQMDRTWQPSMDAQRRESHYRDWKRAVQRSFDWVE